MQTRCWGKKILYFLRRRLPPLPSLCSNFLTAYQNAASAEELNSIPQAFPKGMHFFVKRHSISDSSLCNGDLATLIYKAQHWFVASQTPLPQFGPPRGPLRDGIVSRIHLSASQRPGLHNTISIFSQYQPLATLQPERMKWVRTLSKCSARIKTRNSLRCVQVAQSMLTKISSTSPGCVMMRKLKYLNILQTENMICNAPITRNSFYRNRIFLVSALNICQ